MMFYFQSAQRYKALAYPSLDKLFGILFVLISLTSCGVFGEDGADQTKFRQMGSTVNQAQSYPVTRAKTHLKCTLDLSQPLGQIDARIFGTNLEWFNEGGGLASKDLVLRNKIIDLTKAQGLTVARYPGGTLADYYDWHDGIGSIALRPKSKHPTDSGSSENSFGTPEFFHFLNATHSQGLITVNAGTGSAQLAADWVAYSNQAKHRLREKDGLAAPMNIKLWEIGNELYLPGNPEDVKKITVTPEVYAARYLEFSRAMKAVDPTITTIAIGVAKSHIGPDTEYPEWTKVLLEKASKEIDMIAVHNAYFPMLYVERQPAVSDVYPALMAAPEAVDASLIKLEKLLAQYEGQHKIGIAVTEWGGLFSFPNVDNYWVDHVKTMGTGLYAARMLQVFMAHPRVQLANYFKLTDRSFMGWINYQGEPKVPFWVFALYANYSGNEQLTSRIDSPTYNSPAIGIMSAQQQVPEVTVLASQDQAKGKVYVNFVNRSMTTSYPISLDAIHGKLAKQANVYRIEAHEITAHNGRDIPPEWPYELSYEPYTTAKPNSIQIKESTWQFGQPLVIAPFTVMTLVFDRGV